MLNRRVIFCDGPAGIFDLHRRYEGLDAKSDPLVAILAAVRFELFRRKLKTALVKGGLRNFPQNLPQFAAGQMPAGIDIFR